MLISFAAKQLKNRLGKPPLTESNVKGSAA